MYRKALMPILPGLAILGSASGPAFSQSQESAAVLDEVVVTATHREVSLEDTSMSVVAFSAEDLEMKSIENVEGLRGQTPNLMVYGDTSGGQTSTKFTIRGIPRVGVYIDGVWQPFDSGMMDMALQNVSRLEVLRGPQGTLYGRDSTGGALRIETKDPADVFSGRVSTKVGSNNLREVQASVDIPLNEELKSRVSMYQKDQDGYVESVTLGQDMGQTDMSVLSGVLLWEPNDRFYAKAKFTQTESHPTEARVTLLGLEQGANYAGFEQGMSGLYSLAGHPLGAETHIAGYPGGDLGEWESKTNQARPWDIDISQASLEAGYDLTDNISLKSWTAFVEQDTNGVVDYDNSEYDAVTVWSYRRNEIFSQEFQLSGTHGAVDWLAGAYYWQEENNGRDMWWGFEEFQNGEYDRDVALNTPECTAPTELLDCAGAFATFEDIGDQDEITRNEEEGYALFADVSYQFTDTLSATLGARYHDQDVENETLLPIEGVTGEHPAEVGPVGEGDPYAGTPNFVDSTSFDSFTTRGVLSWNFSEDAMTYVSYSEGFNAGGSSPVEVQGGRELVAYEPEQIESYELGLRSSWFDNSLRLNAWLFHTEWQDIQLESPYVNEDIGVFAITYITQNAASAEAEGLEVEATWLPTDNLKLDFNLGLLDTSYTDFRFGAESSVSSGDYFKHAPEETYSVGAEYRLPLDGGASLTGRMDYSYVSGFRRYEDPSSQPQNLGLEHIVGEFEAGDYGKVDARLVYVPSANANWEVALIGTNLTNEQYTTSGHYGALWELDFSTVGRPREYAVQLKTHF